MTTFNITSALLAKSAVGADASEEDQKKAMLIGMMSPNPVMAYVMAKSLAGSTDEEDSTADDTKATDVDITVGDDIAPIITEGDSKMTACRSDTPSRILAMADNIRDRREREAKLDKLELAILEALEAVDREESDDEVRKNATVWSQALVEAVTHPDTLTRLRGVCSKETPATTQAATTVEKAPPRGR